MPSGGIARAFVTVVATIAGSVVLSGFALLALEQGVLSDAPRGPLEGTSSAAAPGAPAPSSAEQPGTSSSDASGTSAATSLTVLTATPTTTPVLAGVGTLPVVEESPVPAGMLDTTEAPPEEVQYVVARGDALELIAGRFDVTVAEIAERNNLLPPYTLEVGQILIIPRAP